MDVSPCLVTTRSHPIGRKSDRPGCVEGLCADNNKKKKKGGKEEEAAHAGAAEAALGSAAASAPAGAGAASPARWRRRQVTGDGRNWQIFFGPGHAVIWAGSKSLGC
ncbi:Uncharacterized protein Adt_47583 [Abeliophyllum distichum]|uniref:Uncharacterized protein n=1 Tax=Abeliophyllum distichum TaxID=126358 RepID=A0ABD1NU21_9LAMI